MVDESVHITLEQGVEMPARLAEFEKQLHDCFNANTFNITLDMEKINLPPTTFIVTLIEVTSVARRMGGDITLINLSPSTRNNLVTFSHRTYLSIESSEKYALQDFGETFVPDAEFDISDNVMRKGLVSKAGTVTQQDRKKNDQSGVTDAVVELIALAPERIRVHSQVEKLYDICDFVLDKAEQAGFDLRERGKIKVMIYEACLNVVEHAYFSNPEHWIDVYAGYNEKKLVIIIQDWGESFEFDPTREYDVEQAVRDRRTGGFGLHIIRRSVDEIRYLSDPNEGNRLILVKYLPIKD
jgi:serine/threonine-protein kinase RsbW